MVVKVAKIDDEELTSSALDLRFIPYSKTSEEFQLNNAVYVAVHRQFSDYPEAVGGFCRSLFSTIYESQGVVAVESSGNESNLLVSGLAEYISISNNGVNEQYKTTFLDNDYGWNFKNDCLSSFSIILPHSAFRFAPCLIGNSLAFALNRYNRLYISTDGTYIFSEEEFYTGDKIVQFKLVSDEDDIKTIDSFIGFYAPAIFFNVPPDLYDANIDVKAIPAEYRFVKNSGIHEILASELSVEVTFDGEPWKVSYGTSVSPLNSGVSKKLVLEPSAHFIFEVDTDSNLVNEFRIIYSLPKGLYNVATEIYIVDESEPEPNPNPYNPGGVSRPGGGGGSFDGGPTDDPTIFIPEGTTEDNASLSRIYTRYVLDSADLAIVGSRLWATDVINDIINTISKLFSSPFESIISLLSFPFDISSMLGYSAARKVMTWGNTQFILDGLFDVPQTSAVYFDWGEISIESFYDGFLDYAPYTKMELYLPWGTGVVSIDPNECTPGKIRIQSNIELDKGTAVHIVTSEFTRDGRTVKEILGTYGTVVGKQIPITALDNAGKAHAVASVAVTAGAIALAGGAGAASTTSASALTAGASTTALSTSVSPAQLAPVVATDMYPLIYTPKSEEFKITPEDIKLATDGINAAMTPGHVARNGSFMTGSAGLLPTTPFLIISRPEQSVPENYGHYYGYPSNIYSKLSDLSGFTQVGSMHLENIVCTEKEREELISLLQGGVLL